MNDKVKHIIAGFIIGVISAVLIHFWMEELMILAIIPVILAALGKELIWDKWLGKGTPESEDAWFTVWGGLLGIILIYFI